MPEHTRLRLKCVKFRGKQVPPLRFAAVGMTASKVISMGRSVAGRGVVRLRSR